MATTMCAVVLVVVLLAVSAVNFDPSINPIDWLNQRCTHNSNCSSAEARAKCYSGRCKCRPIYFYSNTRKRCDDACLPRSLQDRQVIVYPKTEVLERTQMAYLQGNTKQECKNSCKRNASCMSANYIQFENSRSYCYLYSWVKDTDRFSFHSNSRDHYTLYQKRCI